MHLLQQAQVWLETQFLFAFGGIFCKLEPSVNEASILLVVDKSQERNVENVRPQKYWIKLDNFSYSAFPPISSC